MSMAFSGQYERWKRRGKVVQASFVPGEYHLDISKIPYSLKAVLSAIKL